MACTEDLIGRLSINKLQEFKGTEGMGFGLDLYLDGEYIAHVVDDARGGFFFHYDWTNRSIKETYESWIKTEAQKRNMETDNPADIVIEMLVAEKKAKVHFTDAERWVFMIDWDNKVNG